MRDIDRIDKFLEELGKEWKKVPDWRFGQFIVNVIGACKRDPFFYEEPEMIEHIKNYFKESNE